MRTTRDWLLLLLLVVVSGLSFAAGEEDPPFPDLEMTPLGGGDTVSLESFRGRPVLLAFWASWCGPCRVELPELEELYGELAGTGFVLLTVNVDTSPRAAEAFVDRHDIDAPVFRVDRMTLAKIGIRSLPTSILLDGEGRVAELFRGYSPTMPDQLRDAVLELTGSS